MKRIQTGLKTTSMPRRSIRFWLSVGTAVVFCLLIVWIITRPQMLHLNIDTTEKPDYVFQDPLFAEHYNGVDSWRISARKADLYKSRHQAVLTVVSANIYSEGRGYISLYAPRALIDISNNDATFYNCTLNIPADGIVVVADRLDWVAGSYLLKGIGNAKLMKSNIIITADAFDGYIKTKQLILKNRPKMECTL